jgi:hypothetical protein
MQRRGVWVNREDLLNGFFLFGFCLTFALQLNAAVSSLPRTMQICVNKIIVMARNETISNAQGDLQHSEDFSTVPQSRKHKS